MNGFLVTVYLRYGHIWLCPSELLSQCPISRELYKDVCRFDYDDEYDLHFTV